jgi:hypothetical protein
MNDMIRSNLKLSLMHTLLQHSLSNSKLFQFGLLTQAIMEATQQQTWQHIVMYHKHLLAASVKKTTTQSPTCAVHVLPTGTLAYIPIS